RIADDHGYRHGFAQRAGQSQEGRAHDASLREGHHHFPGRFQRVEPKARAASRWSRGTDSRTSRDTEIMYGITIIASTIPAVMNPTPYDGPAKIGKNPSGLFKAGKITVRIIGTTINTPSKP